MDCDCHSPRHRLLSTCCSSPFTAASLSGHRQPLRARLIVPSSRTWCRSSSLPAALDDWRWDSDDDHFAAVRAGGSLDCALPVLSAHCRPPRCSPCSVCRSPACRPPRSACRQQRFVCHQHRPTPAPQHVRRGSKASSTERLRVGGAARSAPHVLQPSAAASEHCLTLDLTPAVQIHPSCRPSPRRLAAEAQRRTGRTAALAFASLCGICHRQARRRLSETPSRWSTALLAW